MLIITTQIRVPKTNATERHRSECHQDMYRPVSELHARERCGPFASDLVLGPETE